MAFLYCAVDISMINKAGGGDCRVEDEDMIGWCKFLHSNGGDSQTKSHTNLKINKWMDELVSKIYPQIEI